LIGLDSLLQKTPTIAPNEQTVPPEHAFEDADFNRGFEKVADSRLVVESQLFIYL
jgi:hypothetical protein